MSYVLQSYVLYMKRVDVLRSHINIPDGLESVRPVDPNVARLLTLFVKAEAAAEQGYGLVPRTANHVLAAAGKLLVRKLKVF